MKNKLFLAIIFYELLRYRKTSITYLFKVVHFSYDIFNQENGSITTDFKANSTRDQINTSFMF